MNHVMATPHARTSTRLLTDRFEVDRRRGSVVGSRASDGSPRAGVDAESVLSIDHDALRIGTIARPGWGREGVSYGPFERRAGRAFAVHLVNGHNTSESSPIGSPLRRLARWAAGSETDPVWRRLLRYPTSKPREQLARKVRYWWARRKPLPEPQVDNLLVGWLTTPTPTAPADQASGFVVQATGAHNGQLATTSGGRLLPAFRGLQNLPVHYVTVLREQGAIHYAASSYAGAAGLPQHPQLRPIAIDERPLPATVYGGVHQAMLGQIGFSSDTRVYEVGVTDIEELASWCSSAIVADRFTDRRGPIGARSAERGGPWLASGPSLVVDERGVGLQPGLPAAAAGAHIVAPAPVGLLHAVVDGLEQHGEVVLQWRWRGPDDHWRVRLTADSARVEAVAAGRVIASVVAPRQLGAAAHRVQVLDDGVTAHVSIDGEPICPDGVADPALGDQAGVGFECEGSGGARIRHFECHPRAIDAPDDLRLSSREIPLGDAVVVDEPFGPPFGDLDGRQAAPGMRWTRLMGHGRVELVGPGEARFDASIERPIPDRTAYTIDWPDPDHCDLELSARSPGRHGDAAGERCRAGLLVWQDPDNYFAVNIYLDDFYPAASASTFFQFRGFEDIYDAVWSNLGDLVAWNRPFRMRLVCDGAGYLVLVDDQPVLHRAFSDVHPSTDRLRIAKVGLIANWEWGHDTGSTIASFRARRRGQV